VADKEEGAKEPGSPPGGAKVGDSPTPDKLKAAQDAAEKFRKEAETTSEELEAKREELENLKSQAEKTEAERKRMAKLELGIEEDEQLIQQLENQAKNGDRWAKATLAAIDRRAEAIARKVVEGGMTKAGMAREFEQRDEVFAEEAKKRSLSVEKFKELLDPHAAPFPTEHYTPLKQAKLAIAALAKEEALAKRELEVSELEKKHGLFRDAGTSQVGDDKKKPANWRDAKTPQEKEALLADI